MADIEKLRKKRTTHRRNVTKLVNKTERILESEEKDVKRLKFYKDELLGEKIELETLNAEITELMNDNEDEEAADKEMDEILVYKEKLSCCMQSIQEELEKAKDTTLNRSDSQSSLLSLGSISSLSSQSAKKLNVKLPKLELRKFNGKVHEWQEFWDGFCSAIHENEDLAGTDKFKYLKSFLEGPARAVIAGMRMTDKEYPVAVELLKKRYAKPNMIQRAHMNELISLQPVFSEKNVIKLRQFHDEIETHFRGLEAIGVKKSSYSSFIVPILLDKLPESLRISMIRTQEKDQMEWKLDDLISALESEVSIRESHVPLVLSSRNARNEAEGFGIGARPKTSGKGTANTLLTNGKKRCVFCLDEEHLAENCSKIMDAGKRKAILRKFAKCFVCLNSGHRAIDCRSRINCSECKGRHHVSICLKVPNQSPLGEPITKEAQTSLSTPPLKPQANSCVGNVQCGTEKVALQTALARVDGKLGSKVRVLFDTGSHKSFITNKAVNSLGLRPVKQETLGIKVFGKTEVDVEVKDVVELSLTSLSGGKSVRIQCYTIDDIANIECVNMSEVKQTYQHLKTVYFSDFCGSQRELQVDVLIGANFLWQFQEGESIRGGPEEPVAVKTTLGWTLSGPLRGGKLTNVSTSNVNFVLSQAKHDKHRLEESVHRLWDLDSLGIREKDEVHENLIDNISFTGERYQVGLPWKVGHGDLPSNYDISLHRLGNQLKKLKKDPQTFEKYNEIILDQEKAGIVEKVSELESSDKVHYLAHQAVIREEAETTKVRIVFDASCKVRKSEVSLNDCLHVGPPMTPLIFNILLRFRENKIALVGDIEKAFLNIEVIPKDRDCLRFLWVDDIHSEDPKIFVYRFTRVVFGVNSSPFILNAVLRHHIESYQEIDPGFVTRMKEGFYVDDLVSGCNNLEEAYALYQNATVRLQEGGFRLRKFKTNNNELMSKIQEHERENDTEIGQVVSEQCSFAKETLGQLKEAKHKTKVLGVTWDTSKDILEFDLRRMLKNSNEKVTKRSILSILASLFDPQGIISPIAVTAKVLFQDLCVQKLGWDEPLPEEKLSIWKKWVHGLEEVGTISIPRCVYDEGREEIISCQLHGFGDASLKAYSAVIYMVYETPRGIFTRLLCSKTRVAPLKSLSIPRLELMSARILSVLMETVKSALSSQVKVDCTRYWLDSKTALYWIFNNGTWKQFVQHRVNEILGLSKKEEWGHVSGVENPADLGSRGVTPEQLKESKLWWEGPQWLREGENNWPKLLCGASSVEVETERRKVVMMSVVAEERPRLSNVLDINRHSTLKKLLRVTAIVIRFIANLKSKKERRDIDLGPLSVSEIEYAEKLWIKDCQLGMQESPDFKKTSKNLDIKNRNGILVCYGRLENSDLEDQARFPIILPKDHKFTELVIRDCHSLVKHCKVRATLAEVRSRFWITRGRQYVKKVLTDCFVCKRLEGTAFPVPAYAPLPEFRVTQSLPFANIGIDFAGPIYYKTKEGMMKSYIALFTCSVTRAVHLELTKDLTTSTFICSLRRFCARRGIPSIIVTDNAKTFKAAAKFLEKLNKDRMFSDFLEAKRIKWKFNLERAPWWGGHFERMVGEVKRCLRKTVGNAKLSLDELSTLLTEIENTLNARPLTYQGEEFDAEVLTPYHLMYGHRLSSLSHGIDSSVDHDFECDSSSLTKRFLYLTRKLNHFWRRWRREYLAGLRETHRLQSQDKSSVNVGDIVVVHEDNTKRGLWKIAVIEGLIIGKDGVVRGARVRRAGRGKSEVVCRPIQKLYPVESARTKVCKEGKERNVECESKGTEQQSQGTGRPVRAAAKDARWKSQLMLDLT